MIDVNVWEWPQYWYAGLIVFSLGFMVAYPGKSITSSKVALTIGSIPGWTLLLFGGFFN